MEMNYQIVLQMLTNVMLVSFPIALIFMVVQKVVGIFVSFLFGKDVSF